MRLFVEGAPIPHVPVRGWNAKTWSNEVRNAVLTALPPSFDTMQRSIFLQLTFHMYRPTTVPKGVQYPTRGKIDELITSTVIGVVESGICRDRKQIVILHASEIFAADGAPSGCDITITELGD